MKKIMATKVLMGLLLVCSMSAANEPFRDRDQCPSQFIRYCTMEMSGGGSGDPECGFFYSVTLTVKRLDGSIVTSQRIASNLCPAEARQLLASPTCN